MRIQPSLCAFFIPLMLVSFVSFSSIFAAGPCWILIRQEFIYAIIPWRMRIQHGPAAKIEEKETKETSISGMNST
jgi:hypothetical protein